MSAIIQAILSFLSSVLAKVIGQALETPAITDKVSNENGQAKPLDADEYDGLYGSKKGN